MGIFNIFRKRKVEVELPSIELSVPAPMSDEQYQLMRQENIQYLENKYDFTTISGIQAIPNPSDAFKREESKRDFTGRVEYYLLSKAETYKKADKADLAIACLQKANELMPMYGDFYSRDYYLRLPRYLRKLRRFDEARLEESKIQELFHGDYRYINEAHWPEQRVQNLNSQCRALKTDLVAAVYVGCCCSECAKYRGRIYSLKGKDRRFPLFPKHFLNQHSCGLTLTPFIWGINSLSVEDGKCLRDDALIQYSNRPFEDFRTKEEVRLYEDRVEEALRKKQNTQEYNWLWEFHPEICPKSLSGYSKMKSSNSANFQKICIIAAREGFEIVQS